MTDALAAYDSALLALGLFGLWYLVQLVVADVVGVVRGHTPGTPITGDHDDWLFRAARAHANTTESVGAVILLAAFAILRGGNPTWVTGIVWFLLACRVVHTLAYYFDVRLLRSAAFALTLISLFVLFGVGWLA